SIPKARISASGGGRRRLGYSPNCTERSSGAAFASGRAQRIGEAFEAVGDDVPVGFGREIALLPGAVLAGARHEGGLEAERAGGGEVAIVGGDHHDALGYQSQQSRSAQ